MATRVTPYVHSREEIRNYPQVSEGAEEVIAMPVVSNYGPIEPRIVNNRQFLKLFTGNAGIKRSDDLSLKMAYILSRVSSLMICRVIPSTCKLNGVKCSEGSLEAFDYDPGSGLPAGADFAIIPNSLYNSNVCRLTITGTGVIQSINIRIIDETTLDPSVDLEKLTDSTELAAYKAGNLQYLFNENYDFSLNIDSEDGYGNSMFIDRLNELQDYFTVYADSTSTNKAPESSIKFGNSNYVNPVKRDNLGWVTEGGLAIKAAYDKLVKYRRDVKIKFLFDGGLNSLTDKANTTETQSTAANKRKTLGVFTVAPEYSTFKQLYETIGASNKFGGWNQGAGQSSYLYTAIPAKIDQTYFGWRCKLPMSLYYILTVYNNISMNMEFAPVFGKETGLVDASGITIPFEYSNDYEDISGADNSEDTPETEKLQRVGLNPVVWDESLGTGFFINNLTYQTPNLNVMSEENNRRLFNSIQFDINKELDKLQAKANDDSTRQSLDDILSNYKKTVLDPMGYSVKGMRWDIEPYNPAKRNTIELTVEICFNDSIKYVQVLYRAIPVLNS